MANSQGICTSFKGELLNGVHQFGSPTIVSRTSLTAPTADTFKAAIILAAGTITPATTAWASSGINEVSGNNYSNGGVAVAWDAPTTGGTTGYTNPSANLVYGTGGSPVTLSTSFDAVLIYNASQGSKAVGVFTFTAQTITAGVLTLQIPTANSSSALIRLQ